MISGINLGRKIRCEMKNETTQLVFIAENDETEGSIRKIARKGVYNVF
jgi:hypothetical protein